MLSLHEHIPQQAAGDKLKERTSCTEESARQPAWGAPERRLVYASARHSQLVEAMKAIELEVAEALRICAVAHEAQQAIVSKLG